MTATRRPPTASSCSAGSPVDLGDTVAVSGSAQEFSGQTQITSPRTSRSAPTAAADLPAAAALDLPADDAERERLEGMLVRRSTP